MTISVTQLNNYIRGLFDIDDVLNNVSVCGEVTNLKKSRDGWYFSLKDDAASLNCFCYESVTAPEEGKQAVAEGQINYFVKNGSVSFFVRRLTATNNTGAAYLRFIELKEKLNKEGIFDDERKKEIPRCCKTVGVVTSETGAVIHDIENVCLRRQPFTKIILFPVKVQGVGAESEIASGIRYFSDTDVDAVIVGRGGGSNEDLSAFNTEEVVRAVANCEKPVISAVGHGTDFTLCDFAADRRAVTPSEAAEFVTVDVQAIKKRIETLLTRSSSLIEERLKQRSGKVVLNAHRINSRALVNFVRTKNSILILLSDIERRVTEKIKKHEKTYETVLAKISSLNPVNVLMRGYGYISNEEGIVKSVGNLKLDEKFTVTMFDGKINAIVKGKEKNES